MTVVRGAAHNRRMGIKDEMPVLARHEGEWEGTYTYVERDGTVVDRHRSHLTCSFPSEGEWPYFQVNRYTWDDGRTEEIRFPASYKDRAIWFDTERITGRAWEVDERTIVLNWVYVTQPGVYLYELISLDDAAENRSRTWHWFRDGVLYQRTLIDERRVR